VIRTLPYAPFSSNFRGQLFGIRVQEFVSFYFTFFSISGSSVLFLILILISLIIKILFFKIHYEIFLCYENHIAVFNLVSEKWSEELFSAKFRLTSIVWDKCHCIPLFYFFFSTAFSFFFFLKYTFVYAWSQNTSYCCDIRKMVPKLPLSLLLLLFPLSHSNFADMGRK
jgi:hypothetical protein